MNPLVQALKRITKFLQTQHIPYMVIGGIANLVWGTPRSTFDIDITVQTSSDRESLVKIIHKGFKVRVPHPEKFIEETRVLPLQDKAGMNIDLIFAGLPYEEFAIRRAKTIQWQGIKVKICSPEDLIIDKIISTRAKDKDDVFGIVTNMKSKLDRIYLDPIVKKLSVALDRPDIQAHYRDCLRVK